MATLSSNEIAREKNADRIERLLEERQKRFVAGLEKLTSFDMERVEKEVTQAEYRAACQNDLAKILADAEAARRASEE